VPASSGGQGCTPGYWKQPQHFFAWQGYSPDTLFSAVFDDAFAGMTLLEVLKQGGGGLAALGRHTVAALLNASSAQTHYDLTANEVIESFNSVFPGSVQDYNLQKDVFETYNEQGCPLANDKSQVKDNQKSDSDFTGEAAAAGSASAKTVSSVDGTSSGSSSGCFISTVSRNR
jgi:hypothetical protein